MANVLGIGAPRSAHVPLRDGMLAYLREAYPDIHADLFEPDIEAWESARDACLALPVAASSIASWSRYATQLAFMLSVLDRNAGAKDAEHTALGVAFPWASGVEGGRAIAYTSLAVERACVVQSIAAQYALLGCSESRNDKESIKRATAYFQQAAGVLALLETLAGADVQQAQPPVELTTGAVRALRYLMLAQAQECFWQKAAQDGLKDTTIAKLAKSVSDLYESSAGAANASALPAGWKNHILFKHYHFAAAAQYRKSNDDLAEKRYGDELGRLLLAASYVRRALALPTRTLPLPALVEDLQGLQAIVDTNLARAERDNQLIYLEPTTSEANLPLIGAALMAKEAPSDLQAPLASIGRPEHELWFYRLITYGIDVAERLYADRKRHFIASTIEPILVRLDTSATETRSALDLPGLLDRIESPRRMPAAWATYTSTLQKTGGYAALTRKSESVQHTAALCHDLVAEVDGILGRARPNLPEASVVRQHELQTLWRQYRRTLSDAASSDATVREKMASVRPALDALQRGGAALADLLTPQSAALERARRDLAPELRALRANLEQVDDGAAQRRTLLLQLRTACDSDAIRTRLVDAARERHLGDVAQTHTVDPAALQDVLEAGMDKYTPYHARADALAAEQAAQLRGLREKTERLLSHGALAAALDAQDAAHARVDDAYDEYATLLQHLDEGAGFYERLFGLLRTFRAEVHDWLEGVSGRAPQWGAFPGGDIQFRDT